MLATWRMQWPAHMREPSYRNGYGGLMPIPLFTRIDLVPVLGSAFSTYVGFAFLNVTHFDFAAAAAMFIAAGGLVAAFTTLVVKAGDIAANLLGIWKNVRENRRVLDEHIEFRRKEREADRIKLAAKDQRITELENALKAYKFKTVGDIKLRTSVSTDIQRQVDEIKSSGSNDTIVKVVIMETPCPDSGETGGIASGTD